MSELPADFFRTVVQTANEGIWMIDRAGLTTFTNDRMDAMLALEGGEMLGRHPSEFLVEEDLPVAAEVIRRTLSGEPQEFEPRFVRGDGTLLSTLAGTAPIRDESGAIVGAVATFSDITAYKETERALRISEREAKENATLLNHLLESASDAIWMRSVDGVFRVANSAAAAVMVQPGEEVLGRSVYDIWGLKVGAHLTEETEQIFAGGKAVTVEEDMFDAGNNRVTTFFSSKVPIFTAEGEPLGILGISRDITDRKLVENALRDSRTQLAQQLAEVNALYDSAPIGLAFFDRDYRYVRVNDELAEINGVPAADHIGRTVREIIPVNADAVEPVIDRVYATGKPVRDLEVSGETFQQPGVWRHWLTGFYPVKSEDGDVDAVGVWVVEISERKAAEQREHLLAREVDHRAKNLLAVVQSVVQLTRAESVADLKEAVMGRIQSLASAHALLAEARWEGVELEQLVSEEMAPFSGSPGERVEFGGPPVKLRPAAAQSLALVLHELATNAAKYGALRSSGGGLRIQWSINGDPALLSIDWLEQSETPVSPPRRSGFGTRIIITSVERQLRGRVVQSWHPGGLHCVLEIPLDAATAKGDG